MTGLLYNYRSHPTLLKVYNDIFYNSRLIPTVDAHNSTEADILARIFNSKMLKMMKECQGQYFWNVPNGKNIRSASSFSWCNEEEAELVSGLVRTCVLNCSAINLLSCVVFHSNDRSSRL